MRPIFLCPRSLESAGRLSRREINAHVEWWHALILGVVEGVTEYLPVSSTGHLILTASLLGLDTPDIKPSVDAFNIVVQGGAILAVLGLYRDTVIDIIKGLLGRSRTGSKLALNLVVAFLPAAILGVLLADYIEAKLFNAPAVIAALFLGGVWMIWLGRGAKHHVDVEHHDPDHHQITVEDMTWRTALGIGLFQTVAMWPGTSRSMMTIAGGTLLGLHPREAARFSFLLGLPTLGGACVYSLFKNLRESAANDQPNMFEALGWTPILIGVVCATISAAAAVKFLVAFLNKHGLRAFGWYRIALCAVMLTLLATGVISIGAGA